MSILSASQVDVARIIDIQKSLALDDNTLWHDPLGALLERVPAQPCLTDITLVSTVNGKTITLAGVVLKASTGGYSTSVAAAATLTLTSAVAGAYVTVNGVVFTAVAIDAQYTNFNGVGYRNRPTNNFRVGVTDAADTIALAAAINDCNDPRVAGIVTASPATNVVTITAIALGTSGNAITLVSSDGSMVASHGTLQNGAKNNTFDSAGDDTATAISLAKLINAVCTGVFATSALGVVTITATVAGATSAITCVSNDASMSVSESPLAGGADASTKTVTVS